MFVKMGEMLCVCVCVCVLYIDIYVCLLFLCQDCWVFKINLFIFILFIFGCIRSSLLRVGFL